MVRRRCWDYNSAAGFHRLPERHGTATAGPKGHPIGEERSMVVDISRTRYHRPFQLVRDASLKRSCSCCMIVHQQRTRIYMAKLPAPRDFFPHCGSESEGSMGMDKTIYHAPASPELCFFKILREYPGRVTVDNRARKSAQKKCRRVLILK